MFKIHEPVAEEKTVPEQGILDNVSICRMANAYVILYTAATKWNRQLISVASINKKG